MNKCWILLLLLACILLPVQASAESAEETLRSSIDKMLGVLKDDAKKGSEEYARQRKELRVIIDGIFDYQELSSRTVGLYWKRFSPEQKQQFVVAFTDLLGSKYLDTIQSYTNERVEIVGQRESSSGNVEISTNIIAGGKSIPMAYRMTNSSGGWRVYDVVIEGVSLVKNYRSQFMEIMVNGKPEDLIEAVRKKSASAFLDLPPATRPYTDGGARLCT